MRFNLLYVPLVAIAACMASTAVSFYTSAKNNVGKNAAADKADFIFLEAQSAYSDGDLDKYISLIERAFSLNPNDVDIAGEWAMLSLMDENLDSAQAEKSYQMLYKRFMSNPDNIISGSICADVAIRYGKTADAVRIWEILDSIYPTKPQPALELANVYLRSFMTGDSAAFDKAMAIYDRIQSGAGRSIELTNQKLNAYYIKNDTTAMAAELDSLYSSAPKDSYTALFVGANFQFLNNPEKAIKFFDIACELDSTNGPAYLSRAKFYSTQGDSAAYDREVFHALKSQNLDFDSKLEILRSYVSELYTDKNQEPRIRELFTTLQQLHAGEPQVHDLYGAYLYERKDFKGAAEQFSYSIALDPTDESSWMSYIQMSAQAGDTTTVINTAESAMERYPKNLYFPIVASNMYRLRHENKKAMEVMDNVDISVVSNPTAVSNFLTSKGDLYAVLNDTVAAIESYDKAITLDPTNAMALNNAAYFLTLSGRDLDKAENYSARSLKDDELNPTYLDTYAWVFFNKKDYKMAKHYIDIALNSYNEELAEAEADGDVTAIVPPSNEEEPYEEALVEEVTEEGEEKTPAYEVSADIYDHAGDIYFMNGEHAQALKFWEKALELDPDNLLINKKVNLKTIFFSL